MEKFKKKLYEIRDESERYRDQYEQKCCEVEQANERAAAVGVTQIFTVAYLNYLEEVTCNINMYF